MNRNLFPAANLFETKLLDKIEELTTENTQLRKELRFFKDLNLGIEPFLIPSKFTPSIKLAYEKFKSKYDGHESEDDEEEFEDEEEEFENNGIVAAFLLQKFNIRPAITYVDFDFTARLVYDRDEITKAFKGTK